MKSPEQNLKEIEKSLAVDAQYLTKVEVKPLTQEELSIIKSRIKPSYCYDNAITSAVKLDMCSVVYGAAQVKLSPELTINVEHAWIKDNRGTYYDPTYQLLELNKKTNDKTDYFSLIEIPLDEYFDLASDISGYPLTQLTAIDFCGLRMSRKYEKQFKRT
ncbi:hypothetical protein [Vibrio agarivorans]|uniref:hypothetical protein n=1 Tax=Vibrio agarivorans TaxID=153622 RepID=UPI0025B4A683|nr:hypothetical protein [Vibrio agarivorans]MDN3661151.1 hypothetical protein [Vibrio agarivorans]